MSFVVTFFSISVHLRRSAAKSFFFSVSQCLRGRFFFFLISVNPRLSAVRFFLMCFCLNHRQKLSHKFTQLHHFQWTLRPIMFPADNHVASLHVMSVEHKVAALKFKLDS